MPQPDDARVARSLLGGDVSSAWAVWSSAAESALADRFRVVRLGGPEVRKVRDNAVDPVDGRDVHCIVILLLPHFGILDAA